MRRAAFAVLLALSACASAAKLDQPTFQASVRRHAEAARKAPDAWKLRREELLELYKRLGYSMTADSKKEYDTLLSGLAVASAADKAWKKLDQTPKEWMDKFAADNDFSAIQFSRSVWIAAKPNERTRYRMFKDFMKGRQIAGMTVEQLADYLGKPDHETENLLRWEAGPAIGFITVESMSLDFRVTEGVITAFAVVTH